MDQDALLDLLARKDNRAYQYLYRCYYVALKALANYYVKDNDVAEDLVQDVFISLLESGYKFKGENGVKYFLYSSLKNKCISHFRKQKVRDKYYQDILSSREEAEHFWDKVTFQPKESKDIVTIMFIDESRVVRYKSHNNEENKEIIDDVETDGEMLNNAYLGAFENSKNGERGIWTQKQLVKLDIKKKD